MATLVIQGGRKLEGAIRVGGSKNAAGPILAATTLIRGACVLHNMPRISDIEIMVDILASMNAKVTWTAEHSLSIDCTNLDPAKLNQTLVSKIRISVFLLGCLAQRFSKITLPIPGGCNIGSRPLDAHLDALSALGYACESKDDTYSIERVGKPHTSITMSEISVTATENTILASVLGSGPLVIKCAAAEPHVQDLCWFLSAAGAHIEGIGTHELKIQGVSELRGVEYSVIPDSVEVGTCIILAGVTQSLIRIENATVDFLPMELKKFEEVGLTFDFEDERSSSNGNYLLRTVVPKKIRSIRSIKNLKCMPYPGFAADLMQPFALMMTQAEGVSLIHDWMYDGRLRYVSELQKMGANINVLDPHRILVIGPTPLYGKEITSYDLRAGATLVLAALLASGTTTIHGAEQVDRGYQRLDERLRTLGASINRVPSP